jgi:hypothetical protein
MQSERVKVLVDSIKDTFWVPYDLLAQYSTAFKKLRNALNDSGDEICLPDVTTSTFGDFFIWLHAYEPCILRTETRDSHLIDGALHLAVFAQKYQIYHLRNQASDVVRAALRDGDWNITPDMISAVYKVAPAGSALRQLSFLGFVAAEGRTDSTLWQAAFIDCPSLGWDYFQYKNGSELYREGIQDGGACRFHDHSDIGGWVLRDLSDCPYPHGAPRSLPNELVVSTSVTEPVVHDIVVQGALTPVSVKKEAPPPPTVEEVVETEPVETLPTEENTVEPSVSQPSESHGWASETTETEAVETEGGKYQPAEESLEEETTIGDWVSKTKEAEPIVVDGLPAEEEVSHAFVGNARMQLVDEQPVVSKVTLRKKEPIVEVVEKESAVEKSPVVEHVEVVQDLSVPMEQSESTMSAAVENQSTPKGKKGKKSKARRQSQAVNQV